MIVAKVQKMGTCYSNYLYMYNISENSEYSSKILKSDILLEEVTDNPEDTFEVFLDKEYSYILTKDNKEFDTGYSSDDLRRYFYIGG